jgi:hypothetical protein
MKNYTSLSSPPHTDYTKFTGGLGGLADNTMLKRLENYETKEEREINKKSYDNSKLGSYYIPYTSEDIININGEHHSIVVPFCIPILDIIISNDISVDIVDHSIVVGAGTGTGTGTGTDTVTGVDKKDHVFCSGRIRKYSLNGSVKDYDFLIEMENDIVYHVKKRGIMMRISVREDLRKHIIKTMVKYVDDGRSSHVSESVAAVAAAAAVTAKPKKKWFAFLACFSTPPD